MRYLVCKNLRRGVIGAVSLLGLILFLNIGLVFADDSERRVRSGMLNGASIDVWRSHFGRDLRVKAILPATTQDAAADSLQSSLELPLGSNLKKALRVTESRPLDFDVVQERLYGTPFPIWRETTLESFVVGDGRPPLKLQSSIILEGAFLYFALFLIFSGALIASTIWFRYQNRRRGKCIECGYSLAGLPHNTVCPECGVQPNAGLFSEGS